MTIRHPGDLAEFTGRAVVAGVLLVVFGAANAYLGLRVGITVSASIPAPLRKQRRSGCHPPCLLW